MCTDHLMSDIKSRLSCMNEPSQSKIPQNSSVTIHLNKVFPAVTQQAMSKPTPINQVMGHACVNWPWYCVHDAQCFRGGEKRNSFCKEFAAFSPYPSCCCILILPTENFNENSFQDAVTKIVMSLFILSCSARVQCLLAIPGMPLWAIRQSRDCKVVPNFNINPGFDHGLKLKLGASLQFLDCRCRTDEMPIQGLPRGTKRCSVRGKGAWNHT